MTGRDRLAFEALQHTFSEGVATLNIEALARKLEVHRLTAARRVERLYEEKVLTPPQPRIEWGKLGRGLMTLTLTKLKAGQRKKRREQAEREPQLLAYGETSSERDINWFELSAWLDIEHYLKRQEKAKRLNPHHTIIAHMPTRRMAHWPIASLVERAPAMKNMDKLTQNLLLEIFSRSYVKVNENAVARRLGVHRQTVKRRLDAMEKGGLVRRVAPEIRWEKLGLPLCVITLIDFDPAKRGEITKHAASSGRVRWSGPCTSESTLNTFLLSLHADLQGYVDWMEGLRESFEKSMGGHSVRAFVPTEAVVWNDPRKLLEASQDVLD